MGRTTEKATEEINNTPEVAEVEITEEIAEETKPKSGRGSKKDPNRKIAIFLPKQRGLNAKDKQHININGKDFNIPLGEEVEIPYFVYEALMAIEKDKDHEYDFIMANAKIKEIQ